MPLDVGRYERELSALLTGQGFMVVSEPRKFNGNILFATKGGCSLRVQPHDDASTKTAFAFFARDFPVLKYRYRGVYRDSFPRVWLPLHSRLQWFGMRYGLAKGVERPLLIAATRGCDLSTIDFGPQIFVMQRP